MKQETIDRIRKFTEDRDWDQFHSPANLAKSIVIEAAELLECFQWSDEEYDLQHIKEELADVMVYSQNLLDKLGLDADDATATSAAAPWPKASSPIWSTDSTSMLFSR